MPHYNCKLFFDGHSQQHKVSIRIRPFDILSKPQFPSHCESGVLPKGPEAIPKGDAVSSKQGIASHKTLAMTGC